MSGRCLADAAPSGAIGAGWPFARPAAVPRRRPWWRAAGTSRRFVCGISSGRQVVEVLRRACAEVECLAFSADGTLLASGSHDGMILLWEVHEQGHGRRSALSRATAILSACSRFIPAAAGEWGCGRHPPLGPVLPGRAQQIFLGRGEFTRVAFRPDGATWPPPARIGWCVYGIPRAGA